MKRMLSFVIIFSMVFSLAACGVSKEEIVDKATDKLVEKGQDVIEEEINNQKDQLNDYVDQKKEDLDGFSSGITSSVSDSNEPDNETALEQSSSNNGVLPPLLDDVSDITQKYTIVTEFKEPIEGPKAFLQNPKECQHDRPYEYIKSENKVRCRCGERFFDVKDYNQFVKCLRFELFEPGRWFRLEGYCVRTFVTYRGVDSSLLNMIDKVKIRNYDTKDGEKIEELAEVVDSLGNVLVIEMIGMEDADVPKEFEENPFISTLSKTLQTTKMVFDAKALLDAGKTPEEVSITLVNNVQNVAGDLPLFSDMLGMLEKSLKVYQEARENHEKNLEYNSLDDTHLVHSDKWSDLGFPATWEKLTYEHIIGEEKVDNLKLPSIKEITEGYEYYTEKEKIFAQKYILFCLEILFEETVGISYEEYVKYVSE